MIDNMDSKFIILGIFDYKQVDNIDLVQDRHRAEQCQYFFVVIFEYLVRQERNNNANNKYNDHKVNNTTNNNKNKDRRVISGDFDIRLRKESKR